MRYVSSNMQDTASKGSGIVSDFAFSLRVVECIVVLCCVVDAVAKFA